MNWSLNVVDDIGRLSPEATKAVQQQDIDEVFLTALDISHPEMAETLHVINNSEDLQRLGKTYVALPFDLNLPDETAGEMPRLDLGMSNFPDDAGKTPIADALETMSVSPVFELSVFSAARPDVTEYGPIALELESASYDQGEIKGTLVMDPHMTREPHPKDSWDASVAPNIFTRRV
jgi:hypothetical protein